MKPELTNMILSPSSPSSSSSPMRTSRLATPSPPSNDTGTPYEQDPLPDDLVPSLPHDWEPPSYYQLMLSPLSASSEGEVIHM